MGKTTIMLEQQTKSLPDKGTNMPRIDLPSGSSLRLAAILAALVALLLWLAQYILQAGLPVR